MKQNLVAQFVARQPPLEGGLRLEIEPMDGERALLLVYGDDHRFRGRAYALTTPYASSLQRLVDSRPDVDVVLVERATPGLDAAARELDVGYLDLLGRGRLVGPGFVYVAPPATRRDGNGARGPAPRVSPFAPKASRAVRALLVEPSRGWRLTEVAEACRMNPGNAHRVLGSLVELGLVDRHRDRYVVEDPGALLDAWAEQAVRSRRSERLVVPVSGHLREVTEQVVDGFDGAAVVSGELAAELYAPHLPAAHALVHCVDSERWDRDRLEAVTPHPPLRASGHIAIDLVDEGVADFSQSRDGLRLAAPHQVYVDLYRERSRAREAAEHLRRFVVGF